MIVKDVVRYQYKKFVITQAATWITLIQSLKWGLLNKKQNHQLGHLLTDGRVKEIVIGQDYLLLSATGTNSTFTSGSSVL